MSSFDDSLNQNQGKYNYEDDSRWEDDRPEGNYRFKNNNFA